MWEIIKSGLKFSESNESNKSLLKWLYKKFKKTIDKQNDSLSSLDWKVFKPWDKEILNINGKKLWFILDENNNFILDLNWEKTVLTWIWKVIFKKNGLECVKLVSSLHEKDIEEWDTLNISSMLENWKWELKYDSILDKLTKSK